MGVLRNRMFAMAFLLLGGCMMMDMHGPHGAPMETASTGSAAELKDSSRPEASAADKEREMKQEHDAHTGNSSGMAILGGALMVAMML